MTITTITTITGGAGDDTFTIGLGAHSVVGYAGDDLLSVDYSSLTTGGMRGRPSSLGLDGGYGGSFSDGTGNNFVSFSGIERFQITGTNFGDTVSGGINNDSINAGAGDDIIDDIRGIDTIDGGTGLDTLVIGDFSTETEALTINDTGNNFTLADGISISNIEQITKLKTGSGDDVISYTQSISNTVNTGSGNDSISLRLGYHTVGGGSGDDLLTVNYSSLTTTGGMRGGGSSLGIGYISDGTDVNFIKFADIERFQFIGTNFDDSISGGANNDSLYGGAGNDTISGNNGNDSINGGAGDDSINGDNNSAGDDTINGGAGNDTINGSAGNDIINGGVDNDSINGGLGNDTLTGGGGADVFLFNSSLSTTGIDTIIGFSVAADTIQLDNIVFTKLYSTTGVLNVANFVIGTAAVDANDYLIYDQTTGALSYDADGVGTGAAVQIALLGTGLALTNADFVVI